MSRVLVPIFFSRQSVVVDVEGVAIRPRAVVVGRGAAAGCTHISSQEYVHEKQPTPAWVTCTSSTNISINRITRPDCAVMCNLTNGF